MSKNNLNKTTLLESQDIIDLSELKPEKKKKKIKKEDKLTIKTSNNDSQTSIESNDSTKKEVLDLDNVALKEHRLYVGDKKMNTDKRDLLNSVASPKKNDEELEEVIGELQDVLYKSNHEKNEQTKEDAVSKENKEEKKNYTIDLYNHPYFVPTLIALAVLGSSIGLGYGFYRYTRKD